MFVYCQYSLETYICGLNFTAVKAPPTTAAAHVSRKPFGDVKGCRCLLTVLSLYCVQLMEQKLIRKANNRETKTSRTKFRYSSCWQRPINSLNRQLVRHRAFRTCKCLTYRFPGNSLAYQRAERNLDLMKEVWWKQIIYLGVACV